MSIFSPDQYHRRKVLRLSKHNDLVRYAACAAAAKQLGHVRKPEMYTDDPTVEDIFVRTTKEGKTDFLWYGAKYYGLAISAMASELSVEARPSFGLSPDGLPWGHHLYLHCSDGNTSWNEARLIAAEIMCYYEELSGSFRAWGRHLDGMFRLLQLDQAGHQADVVQPRDESPPLWQVIPREILGRTFWRFAQNDIEQSCKCSRMTDIPLSFLTYASHL